MRGKKYDLISKNKCKVNIIPYVISCEAFVRKSHKYMRFGMASKTEAYFKAVKLMRKHLF
jgi:hypothetical protein